MKKLILVCFLFSALSSAAQSYTYIAQRYDWLAGLFRALGLPAGDGPAAFQTGQRVRAGSVYYDSTGVDAGLYIWDGSTWVLQGSNVTGSEGITVSSGDVKLGGLVSAPAALSNDRHILANRRILSFSNTIANNNWWQFSDSLFSPFQFSSTDTITSNDMVLSRTRPLSTMNIQRNILFASGIYQQTKMYGALRASTKIIWGDSVKIRTDGGDYHTNIVEFRFSPTGTGRQRAKIGHGTGSENDAGEAVPALIANMYVDNPDLNSTDTTVINGTIAGIAPYLVANLGTAKIRIKRYISVQPNNFVGTSTFIEKYIDYASRFKVGTNSVFVDSAYFMWDTSMFKRTHLRGPTHIGTGNWSSTDAFNVGGNANITDSLIVGKATNIADSTGMDFVLRRRTDGSIFRITATQAATFFGSTAPTLQDVLDNDNNTTTSIFFNSGASSIYSSSSSVTFDQGGGNSTFFQGGTTAGRYRWYPTAAVPYYEFNGSALSTTRTITFQDASGTVAYLSDIAGGGATTALDNLASVAINTSLISDANNTDDLGSSANGWKDAYAYRYIAKGSTSGTVEYKSDALGNAPNITTLSGTGYGVAWMESRETSDFTGQNVNTVQPMFNTAQDVFTLQGSTAYDFEGFLSLNHLATSHSVGLSFELGGGASVTSISYFTWCWVTAIGTNTASQTTNFIQTTANTAVNAAGANATEQIYFKGTINMNAGGTVTPSYTFSAAPGGPVLTKAGSFIKFTPKGTDTFTTIGNVN